MTDEVDQTKRGLAIAFKVLVQTASAGDPFFKSSFLDNLNRAQVEARNDPANDIHALETLAWIRTLVADDS